MISARERERRRERERERERVSRLLLVYASLLDQYASRTSVREIEAENGMCVWGGEGELSGRDLLVHTFLYLIS